MSPARETLLLVGADRVVKRALLDGLGAQVHIEETGLHDGALARITERKPRLVIAFGDGNLQRSLLDRARGLGGDTGCLLIADRKDAAAGVDWIRRGADDYMLRPFAADELIHRVRRVLEYRRLRGEAEGAGTIRTPAGVPPVEATQRLLLQALLAMGEAIELREGYSGSHVARVTRLAVATARRMGLDATLIHNVWIGSLLHDLGKVAIPDEILQKPTRLSMAEEDVMRQHPVIGASIIGRSEHLRPALPGLLHHHERWDGGGYPHGLAGAEIPIEGRIIAVSEAYDALVTRRPYRGKRTRAEALRELRRCSGGQFDAEVVDVFLRSLGQSDGLDPGIAPPIEVAGATGLLFSTIS